MLPRFIVPIQLIILFIVIINFLSFIIAIFGVLLLGAVGVGSRAGWFGRVSFSVLPVFVRFSVLLHPFLR